MVVFSLVGPAAWCHGGPGKCTCTSMFWVGATGSEMITPSHNDSPMPSFSPPRLRDACGVFRGFVYQVDLTIDRWLSLPANAALELERGEDIDLVVKWFHGDDEASRLLEQVKHRDRSITLRSPEAVEAIANAIEHRNHNPSMVLSFQFTTNAVAGVERPTPLPGGGSAIAAWEEVRAGIRCGDAAEDALTAIRTLLADRKKPEKYPDDAWQSFRAVVDAPDNVFLRPIVASFSWSTRTPGASSIKRILAEKLVDLGHAGDRSTGEAQYRRLFLHVLELLCHPGVKRLEHGEYLPLLDLRPLAEEDQRKADLVFERLESLEERVRNIETQQASDRREIEARIAECAQAQKVTAAVTHLAARPSLQPALPPTRVSHRVETVATLLPVLHDHTWVELHGTVGLGKSELARVLAEAGGGLRVWLDFRDLERPVAAMMMDAAVRQVSGPFPPRDRTKAYSRFVAELAHGAVVVADDLPPLSPGDRFTTRLLELVSACQNGDARLITTSLVSSPQWVRERMGEGVHSPVLVPPFADSEVLELLHAYKAPLAWRESSVVSFLNTTTSGHATLLAAGIRYLEAKRWELRKEELLEFIGGHYATDLRRETIERLLHLISDGDSRDLLYRLNLAILPVTEQEIWELAAAAPPIARPAERLQSLIDICVQRAPAAGLRVSPLFKLLGHGDVAEPTQKECHRILGVAIIRRKAVSIDEATAAITHLLAGGDPNGAAIIMLRALVYLGEYEGPIDGSFLTAFWESSPMLDTIDLGLRIAIRAKQASLRHRMGKPVEYMISDLEVLVSRAGPKEAWAVVIASATVQLILAKIDVRRANRFLANAVRALPVLQEQMGPGWQNPPYCMEELFWINTVAVRSIAEMDDWLSTVDTLTSEQRQSLFSSDIAADGCWKLCDVPWMAEAEKPAPERDWQKVSHSLQRLGDYSEQWKQPILMACAIRGLIVVRAEYLNDLPGAIALAQDSLHDGALSGVSAYPVCECIGRQFKYHQQPSEARVWLKRAINEAGQHWTQHRIATMVNLASVSEPPEVASWLIQANEVTENDPATPPLYLVRVKGELALACLQCEKPLDALRLLDESLDLLIQARADEDEEVWKATAAQWGHSFGYIGTLITTGKPPETAGDGSRYVEPKIGMLMTLNLECASWPSWSRLSFLYGMVAAMADSLHEDDVSARRAVQALDIARKSNELLALSLMGHRHAISLVTTDRHSEALDLALQSAAAFTAVEKIRQAGGDIYATNRTADDVLGDKPSDEWSQAESTAVIIAVLPVAIRIATTALSDPHAAEAMATEIISSSRIIGHTASDTALWQDVGGLFQSAFVKPITGRELVELGREFGRKKKQALQAMAYIGATTRPDCRAEIAVMAQLCVVAGSRQFMTIPDGAEYRRVVLPFLEQYWERVFQQAFRFTPPALYRDLFARAKAEPPGRRAQAILQTAFHALRVPIPAEYREWISGNW